MHVIMGATGHIGAAVAETLVARGEPVTIITHIRAPAEPWHRKGVQIVEADVNDVTSLRAAFQGARRAFLLNAPADTKLDTDPIERRTVANILVALDGSGLEKVVAESTAGAQPGERIGDLSVLWELEEGLRHQPIPAAINRAPYYMSNWDQQLDAVRDTGELQTMFPADMKLPMAAPADIGAAAAERMLASIDDVGVRVLEGPDRYSPRDVARAFSLALGRPVEVVVTPPEQWESAYLALGFSPEAAKSYTRMTAASIDGFDRDETPIRGTTTLDADIGGLVAAKERFGRSQSDRRTRQRDACTEHDQA